MAKWEHAGIAASGAPCGALPTEIPPFGSELPRTWAMPEKPAPWPRPEVVASKIELFEVERRPPGLLGFLGPAQIRRSRMSTYRRSWTSTYSVVHAGCRAPGGARHALRDC
jgi:hypothetical protein